MSRCAVRGRVLEPNRPGVLGHRTVDEASDGAPVERGKAFQSVCLLAAHLESLRHLLTRIGLACWFSSHDNTRA